MADKTIAAFPDGTATPLLTDKLLKQTAAGVTEFTTVDQVYEVIEDLTDATATAALTDKIPVQVAAGTTGYVTTNEIAELAPTVIENLTDLSAATALTDKVAVQNAASAVGYTELGDMFALVEDLTDLSASVALTDLVPLQTAASATGQSDIASILGLLPLPDYASIYVTSGATAQTLSTTPATLTAFTADGPSNGATPAHASDSITIGTTGIYYVALAASFSGDANATITMMIYADAAATSVALVRKLGATGDVGSAGAIGLVSLTAGEVVTVKANCASSTKDITAVHAQLSVVRIR